MCKRQTSRNQTLKYNVITIMYNCYRTVRQTIELCETISMCDLSQIHYSSIICFVYFKYHLHTPNPNPNLYFKDNLYTLKKKEKTKIHQVEK